MRENGGKKIRICFPEHSQYDGLFDDDRRKQPPGVGGADTAGAGNAICNSRCLRRAEGIRESQGVGRGPCGFALSGWAEDEYWAIAPYLVQVDDAILQWIIENLWKDPWGIFAVTSVGLEALRKHFRRFLKVLDPNGKELLFRFYDPRVLPDFLSTTTPDEAKTFSDHCGDSML